MGGGGGGKKENYLENCVTIKVQQRERRECSSKVSLKCQSQAILLQALFRVVSQQRALRQESINLHVVGIKNKIL